MSPKTDLNEHASKSCFLSLWDTWCDKGPRADEFGVVIPLPNGRLALVTLSESGFDVEDATYVLVGHPLFSVGRPNEAVLIPYSTDFDSEDLVEGAHRGFLIQELEKKRQSSRAFR